MVDEHEPSGCFDLVMYNAATDSGPREVDLALRERSVADGPTYEMRDADL
jgi:hypothetical protein